MFCVQEEKFVSGTGESFGKQWTAGDCVGVFLDLVDRTISKYSRFCFKHITLHDNNIEFSQLHGCVDTQVSFDLLYKNS